VTDPLDQRTALAAPKPLSATDRSTLECASRILAIEARECIDRASLATGGPGDLARALECSQAARAIQELLARRGAR